MWRPRVVAVPVAALVLPLPASALGIGRSDAAVAVGLVTAVLGAAHLLRLLTRRRA
jgi:hypothetical protein